MPNGLSGSETENVIQIDNKNISIYKGQPVNKSLNRFGISNNSNFKNESDINNTRRNLLDFKLAFDRLGQELKKLDKIAGKTQIGELKPVEREKPGEFKLNTNTTNNNNSINVVNNVNRDISDNNNSLSSPTAIGMINNLREFKHSNNFNQPSMNANPNIMNSSNLNLSLQNNIGSNSKNFSPYASLTNFNETKPSPTAHAYNSTLGVSVGFNDKAKPIHEDEYSYLKTNTNEAFNITNNTNDSNTVNPKSIKKRVYCDFPAEKNLATDEIYVEDDEVEVEYLKKQNVEFFSISNAYEKTATNKTPRRQIPSKTKTTKSNKSNDVPIRNNNNDKNTGTTKSTNLSRKSHLRQDNYNNKITQQKGNQIYFNVNIISFIERFRKKLPASKYKSKEKRELINKYENFEKELSNIENANISYSNSNAIAKDKELRFSTLVPEDLNESLTKLNKSLTDLKNNSELILNNLLSENSPRYLTNISNSSSSKAPVDSDKKENSSNEKFNSDTKLKKVNREKPETDSNVKTKKKGKKKIVAKSGIDSKDVKEFNSADTNTLKTHDQELHKANSSNSITKVQNQTKKEIGEETEKETEKDVVTNTDSNTNQYSTPKSKHSKNISLPGTNHQIKSALKTTDKDKDTNKDKDKDKENEKEKDKDKQKAKFSLNFLQTGINEAGKSSDKKMKDNTKGKTESNKSVPKTPNSPKKTELKISPPKEKKVKFTNKQLIINYEDKKLITNYYMTDEEGNSIKKPYLTFKNNQKQKFDKKSILKPYSKENIVKDEVSIICNYYFQEKEKELALLKLKNTNEFDNSDDENSEKNSSKEKEEKDEDKEEKEDENEDNENEEKVEEKEDEENERNVEDEEVEDEEKGEKDNSEQIEEEQEEKDLEDKDEVKEELKEKKNHDNNTHKKNSPPKLEINKITSSSKVEEPKNSKPGEKVIKPKKISTPGHNQVKPKKVPEKPVIISKNTIATSGKQDTLKKGKPTTSSSNSNQNTPSNN